MAQVIIRGTRRGETMAQHTDLIASKIAEQFDRLGPWWPWPDKETGLLSESSWADRIMALDRYDAPI